MSTIQAPISDLNLAIAPHAQRQERRQSHPRYGLAIRAGDKLSYALWRETSQPNRASSRFLRIEVNAIETELRVARDLSAIVAMATPICTCNCDGHDLDGDVWRRTLAGQVAYPTEMRFWGRWMAVERSWDGASLCDGLTRPHALFEEGVITLSFAASSAQGDSAWLTMDRHTGIVIQAQRYHADGSSLTALLVDHTLSGFPA